jgi:hypothetical protein
MTVLSGDIQKNEILVKSGFLKITELVVNKIRVCRKRSFEGQMEFLFKV